MLDLSEEERTKLLALPPESQEEKVLELKRSWIKARIEEKGLPPGLSAEEWERMQSLSDREFFTRLRGAEGMPEHLRGRGFFGRGRGMRGRDGERRDGERRGRGAGRGGGVDPEPPGPPGQDAERRGRGRRSDDGSPRRGRGGPPPDGGGGAF